MKFELTILEGGQAGQRLPIGDAPVTFGRSPSATFSFPQDTFMSGMHLTIQATPEGIALNDPRSTNGTFLNGQRVATAVARPGDVISLGKLKLQVEPAATEAASPQIPQPVVVPVVIPVPQVPKPEDHGALRLLSAVRQPLFCLVDAAADPAIPALLRASSQTTQIQCLYDGLSAATLARWAPYLIYLPQGSPILRTLVEKGWGKGWASYFIAHTSMEDLRRHFRHFLLVQIEDGEEVYFRFYDPRVLRDFLPTATPRELAQFFGPVVEWMVESEKPEVAIGMANSPTGLTRREFPLRSMTYGSAR